LGANLDESSVHLGFSVLALVAFAWIRGGSQSRRPINLFAALAVLFGVLALGPTLQIAGKEVVHEGWLMPYGWLQRALPFLAVSGVPIRMMVMVTLGAAVLSAFGFEALWSGSARERAGALVLLAILVVEYLPKPIPLTPVDVPGYVTTLRDAPGSDGVLDLVSGKGEALAYQTTHAKPLAFGYIARV